MSNTIYGILQELRDDARNNRDLGDKFERLIQAFLTKDPYYADLFSDVWLWMEWPDRGNKPDTGIDLVARERDDPEYILRLLKSIVTVSLETMTIVNALPPLNERMG
jgi:predicted helicase